MRTKFFCYFLTSVRCQPVIVLFTFRSHLQKNLMPIFFHRADCRFYKTSAQSKISVTFIEKDRSKQFRWICSLGHNFFTKSKLLLRKLPGGRLGVTKISSFLQDIRF
jgi:hypothetical protein